MIKNGLHDKRIKFSPETVEFINELIQKSEGEVEEENQCLES